jgi:hypothetical protein
MTQTQRPSFFRRKFLIMPSFQLTLILWNALITIAIFIIVLLQVNLSMREMKKMGDNAGFHPENPFFKFIDEIGTRFYSHVSIAFLVGLIVSTLMTIYISHKMAGPLYRMRTYFQKISDDGQVKDISFRKGDYLSDFAVIINAALAKIKK